jgi:hypothetical protein
LDLSSTYYTQWRDNVLPTLERYYLSDHVLMDTTYADVLSWGRMDSVVEGSNKATRGGELEPIKIPRCNSAYILKSI